MSLNDFKEKLRKKLGVDTIIVGVAILTLGLAAFFFFEDSFFSNSNHNAGEQVVVGKIVHSHNDVRRRIESALSWGTVASADRVYEGDSIFTGDASDAKIKFDKGTELSIEPKSLVVIHTKGSQLEVDLQYGSLKGKVQTGQQIVLSQDGHKKQILSSNAAEIHIVRAENSHNTEVKTLSGELKVEDKPLTKVAEKEPEVVTPPAQTPAPPASAPDKKADKKTVTLVSPSTGKSLWLDEGKKIDFTWQMTGAGEQDKYSVEFSQTENFDTPLKKQTVQGQSFQLAEKESPQGRFYWRVRSENGDATSAPSLLAVYRNLPPHLETPTDKFTFIPQTGAASSKQAVAMTWKDESGSSQFEVQVSKEADFKNPILDEKTKTAEPQFQTAALDEGAYHWRVKGLHAEREVSPWSEGFSFTIQAAAPPPQVPVLSKTEINYEIPESVTHQLSPSEIAALSNSGKSVKAQGLAPFQWSSVAQVTGYEVEMADNQEFKNPTTAVVAQTRFAPTEVHPGSYFVRVRAVSANGIKSEASPPGRLNVQVIPPKLAPLKTKSATFSSLEEMQNDRTKYTFDLSWKKQPFASGYEVEWGADPSFKLSKKFQTKELSRPVSVTKSMQYAARVRALDASGAPISRYSNVQVAALNKVVVAPEPKMIEPPEPVRAVAAAPPVAKPEAAGLAMPMIHASVVLREPLAETALISLESSPTFVNFKWKPVSGVSYYVLQIAKDADFTDPITEVKVQKTSFVFEKQLPEGKIFWRVRFQKGKIGSEWSDVSNIMVIYQ